MVEESSLNNENASIQGIEANNFITTPINNINPTSSLLALKQR